MGIEPPEVPPATPGHPTEPPQESPPGNPRPEVPPPVHEPGEPATPEELPGRTPDEYRYQDRTNRRHPAPRPMPAPPTDRTLRPFEIRANQLCAGDQVRVTVRGERLNTQ
jgi:hypothetical protein